MIPDGYKRDEYGTGPWDNSASASDMTQAQIEDRVYGKDRAVTVVIAGCEYYVRPPRISLEDLQDKDKPPPFEPPPVSKFERRPPKFQRCPHRIGRSRRRKR